MSLFRTYFKVVVTQDIKLQFSFIPHTVAVKFSDTLLINLVKKN